MNNLLKDNLLSVVEAANYLDISPHTLRGWVSQKRIKHLKVGRRCLFKAKDIENFLQACTVEPKSYGKGSSW